MQIPKHVESAHGEAFGVELRALIGKYITAGISSRDQLACLAALVAETTRGLVQCEMPRAEAARAVEMLWDYYETKLKEVK
jgi:hypothetical protein